MTATELKTLAKITSSGWRRLAKMEDAEDAAELREILVELLESLDGIQAAAEAKGELSQ